MKKVDPQVLLDLGENFHVLVVFPGAPDEVEPLVTFVECDREASAVLDARLDGACRDGAIFWGGCWSVCGGRASHWFPLSWDFSMYRGPELRSKKARYKGAENVYFLCGAGAFDFQVAQVDEVVAARAVLADRWPNIVHFVPVTELLSLEDLRATFAGSAWGPRLGMRLFGIQTNTAPLREDRILNWPRTLRAPRVVTLTTKENR